MKQEEYFYLGNGEVLRTIGEFRVFLDKGSDEEFALHVNSEKNDFAIWVKGVFKNNELADVLEKAKDKDSMIKLIDDYFHDLIKNPDENQKTESEPVKKEPFESEQESNKKIDDMFKDETSDDSNKEADEQEVKPLVEPEKEVDSDSKLPEINLNKTIEEDNSPEVVEIQKALDESKEAREEKSEKKVEKEAEEIKKEDEEVKKEVKKKVKKKESVHSKEKSKKNFFQKIKEKISNNKFLGKLFFGKPSFVEGQVRALDSDINDLNDEVNEKLK